MDGAAGQLISGTWDTTDHTLFRRNRMDGWGTLSFTIIFL